MQRGKIRSSQGGFSLLEVMFGTLILLIALLGVSASTATFASLRRVNEETQLAELAARQRLDLVRGTAFNQITATYNNFDFQVDLSGDGQNDLIPRSTDADGNVGKITVTSVGPAADPSSLLQVTIVLDWSGVGGNRRYQIGTMISNRAGT